jgi:purine-binding chemotaxis protein CheW
VTRASAASARGPGDPEIQHLTFRIGTEEYAIEIQHVHEIKSYSGLTLVPNAPAHVKGVMNLRGTIIPVVDLRDRFAMAPVAYDKFTVVVIVSVLGKLSGVVVDAVNDLIGLKSSDSAPPPDLGKHVDTSFMRGMAKTQERLVIVLDLERTIGEVMNYGEAGTSEESETCQ